MEVTITTLKKEHLKNIFQLIRKTVESTFQREGFTDVEIMNGEIDRINKRFETLAENSGESKVLVALVNTRVVGTIGIDKLSESFLKIFKKTKLKVDGQKIIEICLVYVLPEYQGQRIATKLINQIFEYIKSNKYSYYALYSGYAHTIPIWRKFFGEEKCMLKSYFADAADCYIWLNKIN